MTADVTDWSEDLKSALQFPVLDVVEAYTEISVSL